MNQFIVGGTTRVNHKLKETPKETDFKELPYGIKKGLMCEWGREEFSEVKVSTTHNVKLSESEDKVVGYGGFGFYIDIRYYPRIEDLFKCPNEERESLIKEIYDNPSYEVFKISLDLFEKVTSDMLGDFFLIRKGKVPLEVFHSLEEAKKFCALEYLRGMIGLGEVTK